MSHATNARQQKAELIAETIIRKAVPLASTLQAHNDDDQNELDNFSYNVGLHLSNTNLPQTVRQQDICK